MKNSVVVTLDPPNKIVATNIPDSIPTLLDSSQPLWLAILAVVGDELWLQEIFNENLSRSES